MILLHVLTACSRPEGLPAISQALAAAPAGVTVRWHIGFDLARQHVGGQAVKNALLDDLTDGWVWICDDDNLPASGFLDRLVELLGRDCAGYLFGQMRPGGAVPALPPAVGRTDVAQLVVRREAVGDLRIPEQYDGDGHWICQVWTQAMALIDEPLTGYNAQRWR